MAKLFLSFLGTGEYKKCIYQYGSKNGFIQTCGTEYIQEALIDFFCNDFTKEDRIIIFVTGRAEQKNWLDEERRKGDGTVCTNRGLCSVLQNKKTAADIKVVNIPAGADETEIWRIFTIIYETINEKDSILFDITHSFRSLLLLGMAVLNYARYLKQCTIEGIYYGAYEAKNVQTDTVPVFPLTSFYDLMRWTSTAEDFVKYGSAAGLEGLIRESAESNRGSLKVAQRITAISDIMNTVRGKDIQEAKVFTLFRRSITEQIEMKNFQAPFIPLFNLVNRKINCFTENNPKNYLYAVKWFMDSGMLQQAYTLLEEGTLTYLITKQHGPAEKINDPDFRSSFLHTLFGMAGRCGDSAGSVAAVCDALQKIAELRNDLNHAGFRKSAKDPEVFRNNIQKYYGIICDNLDLIPEFSADEHRRSAYCLLNHQLTSKQIQELEKEYLITAEDIIYPGNALKDFWKQISADDFTAETFVPVLDWLKNAQAGDVVIVQGEAGATFSIVGYCLRSNLVPVHSVTKRVETEYAEGEKIHREYEFEHIRFRKYCWLPERRPYSVCAEKSDTVCGIQK